LYYPNSQGMQDLLQALDTDSRLDLLPTIWKGQFQPEVPTAQVPRLLKMEFYTVGNFSCVFQISRLWVMITSLSWWRSCSAWWPERNTVLRSGMMWNNGCFTHLRHTDVQQRFDPEANISLSMFLYVSAGSGVFCRLRSGCKECDRWEAQSGVERLLPVARHHPAAVG